MSYTFCRYFVYIVPENAIRIEIIIPCAYRIVQLAALHILVENDGEIMIRLVRFEKLIQIFLILKRMNSFCDCENVLKTTKRKKH